MLKQRMTFLRRSDRSTLQPPLWLVGCSVLVGVMMLVLAPSASAQSRELMNNLAGAFKGMDLKSFKVPNFKSSLSADAKRKAMQAIDDTLARDVQRQMKEKGASTNIQYALRVWEGLSIKEKYAALSGQDPPAAIPTWAVAAVGAAALAYEVGKDYSWWGKKSLTTRTVNEVELDYVKKLGAVDAYQGGLQRHKWVRPAKLERTVLDY